MFLLNYTIDNKVTKDKGNRLLELDDEDNTGLILAVTNNKGDAVLAILEYLSH
jgi:hypothetical protein